MKRKKKKQKSRRVSRPLPGSCPSQKSYMIVVVFGLLVGVCLVAGILYLRKPKPLKLGPTNPVLSIPNEKETEDFESLLFGEAQSVPQVIAEAQKLANHIIERFPQSEDALLLMGSVYGQLGIIEENMAWWEKALHLNPQRADVCD